MPVIEEVVSFLFTEIGDSARLWEEHQEDMWDVLARHDAIVRDAVISSGGKIFKTGGGSFCVAFREVSHAVGAASNAQRALGKEKWKIAEGIAVRMAVHVGPAELRQRDYFGPPLNRAARLLAAARGGQILLSQAAQKIVEQTLPADLSLLDLGVHRLRDLTVPEHVFQLCGSGLRETFPPLLSLESFAHNLPIQLTTFVGRTTEIVDVKRLLETTRFLTLTGTGGCGKTRLALQVAAELIEREPDGIWLVELGSLTDPGLFSQTVAGALGIREIQDRPVLETLVEELENKKLLLILDDCDHMVRACAELVRFLLPRCPRIRILATSREPLGIEEEKIWNVPPLSLPDEKQGSPFEIAAKSDAVQLFVERATAANPGFVLTPRNFLPVVDICGKLEGLPLAIELAAAEVRLLTVEQIAQRLSGRFWLLAGGSRMAVPRHRTLNALIDWSYDYLPKEEQIAFVRLGVFVGAFSEHDAVSICGWNGIEPAGVPEILEHLVSKSLLARDKGRGKDRFRYLVPIQHYSSQKLFESGESADVRNRHLDHYLRFAEDAEAHLKGADQGLWLAELESGHGNLRSALEWCLSDEGRLEKGVRLAGSLSSFWYYRGYLSEGRERLSAFLTRAKNVSGIFVAKAAHGAGILAMNQGDYAEAATFLNHSIELFRAAEERKALPRVLNSLGLLTALQGDYVKARSALEESLSGFRELDDRQGIAATLDNLGNVASKLGDLASARAYCEESLAASRSFGDRRSIGISHHHLGNLCMNEQDYNAASSHFFRALDIRAELGDKQGIAISLEGLANLAIAKGDFARAARLFGGAQALRKAIGAPLPVADRPDYEHQQALLMEKLGSDAFVGKVTEGREFKLEELVSYARE